jgi:hypothetical protein
VKGMTRSLLKVRRDWRVRLAGVLTLALIVAVVVLSLKPDTDEERFRQMRRAKNRAFSLMSQRWIWLNRASEFILGESLKDREMRRYEELSQQLEKSGFIVRVEVSFPGLPGEFVVVLDPLSQTLLSNMSFRGAQENLYWEVESHGRPDEFILICPKRDVDGWRLFLSNLATNNSPAID